MDLCPTPDELEDLLDDDLDEAARKLLEGHLDDCGVCQEVLLHLTDESGAIGPLLAPSNQSRTSAHTVDPPEEFVRDLQKIVRRGAAGSNHADPNYVLPQLEGLEVLEQIGSGGMGIVYRARQIPLNRTVALKIIPKDRLGTAVEFARAWMGVEAIARLGHPNIVRILRVGRHDEFFFGVLEYIDGGNLKQHKGGRPWLPREAAEIMRTLARTVQVIHSQGIIHRDLKTSNILMTSDGVPKIADFGLALDAALGRADTLSGEILGTPHYMAPEQAAGRIDEIGPTTDVYALGAILYELLVGRPPFEGSSRFETLHSVVHAPATPPSQRRIDVPADLEAVCMKCLEKSPTNRYSTAAELADDLDRFLSHRPVAARARSLPDRAALMLRRQQHKMKRFIRNPVETLRAAVSPARLGTAPADPFLNANGPLADLHRLAEAALDEAEQAHYLARLAWAQQQLLAGNPSAARETLNQCFPNLSRPDRRTPVWHELWKRCDPKDA